ncbi:hypothetical protein E4U13_005410 [Claviceps humidiphila]|uniref:Uncharacterized protein n=1 Tax=Claviceps humidiphila TaxID=1294629 RepID=A0A9P7PYH7_9HYPO|nr:hypothetical protein E4U13_005410 [Claviceps humidiphila]
MHKYTRRIVAIGSTYTRAFHQTLRIRPLRRTMTQMSSNLQQAELPNTCQYTAKTRQGDYVVQIAWPLSWTEDRKPRKNDASTSILYLVDGNAYFFTAVDVSRRIDFTNNTKTIVVGISYPPSEYVYDLYRRGPDLTPPSEDGQYEPIYYDNGEPQTHLKWGEADNFLAAIQHDIMPFVEKSLFGHLFNGDKSIRRGLFGHSYGGLFSLNALYTKPMLFDAIIAASPTIWWNKDSIVNFQEKNFRAGAHPVPGGSSPSLILTWGSGKAEFPDKDCAEGGAWNRHHCDAEEDPMEESMSGLVGRLRDSGRLKNIWTWKLQSEDHGSAAVAGLQRGMWQFLLGL